MTGQAYELRSKLLESEREIKAKESELLEVTLSLAGRIQGIKLRQSAMCKRNPEVWKELEAETKALQRRLDRYSEPPGSNPSAI